MTTELRLQVILPGSATTYLDLGALLSAANHRLYRQHYLYKAEFRIEAEEVPTNGDQAFTIGVLPTSWPLMKSLKMAKEKAMEALDPERGMTKVARWNDFRMYFDTAHKSQGFVQQPLGVSLTYGGNAQYEYTSVFDESGNNHTFHVLGPSVLTGLQRSFGALDEYDRSGDTDTDNVAPGNNYGDIINDVEDQNIDTLTDQGQVPPYHKDNLQVPQKQYSLMALASTPGAGYAVRTTGLVDVPCGLVRVANAVAANRTLTIRFKAGKYKGVHAEAL